MKKVLNCVLIVFAVFINLFFIFNIFLKFFFNDFYISTPNLAGQDIIKLENEINKKDITFKIMGSDFSDFKENEVYSQIPKTGKIIKKGRTIQVWISKGKKEIKVPDFKGMKLSDARVLAGKKGLAIDEFSYTHHKYNFNQVIASDPKAGNIVNANSKISFLISLNKNSKFLFMPDIIGLDLKEVREILEKNGLAIGNIDYIYDKMFQSNIVLDSNPNSGTKLLPGTVVNLIINKKDLH